MSWWSRWRMMFMLSMCMSTDASQFFANFVASIRSLDFCCCLIQIEVTHIVVNGRWRCMYWIVLKTSPRLPMTFACFTRSLRSSWIMRWIKIVLISYKKKREDSEQNDRLKRKIKLRRIHICSQSIIIFSLFSLSSFFFFLCTNVFPMNVLYFLPSDWFPLFLLWLCAHRWPLPFYLLRSNSFVDDVITNLLQVLSIVDL